MGYCEAEDRDRIQEIRRQETLVSFELIGVEDVRDLDFPDCNLSRYLGRRLADAGEPGTIEGFTGLQNAYTHELRRRRPTRLFLASGNDLHPDHKSVYTEARVSVFHAGGAIWPELGSPLDHLPTVYELAIYGAFPDDPEYLIQGSMEHFERKLDAISAYRSQKQIGRLVERLRKAGPIEYLKLSDLNLYSPKMYRHLFETDR
jgi:LmbE family N-acetylglucosaminyl deacetylase